LSFLFFEIKTKFKSTGPRHTAALGFISGPVCVLAQKNGSENWAREKGFFDKMLLKTNSIEKRPVKQKNLIDSPVVCHLND